MLRGKPTLPSSSFSPLPTPPNSLSGSFAQGGETPVWLKHGEKTKEEDKEEWERPESWGDLHGLLGDLSG